MKVLSLVPGIRAIVFDIDGTLYRNPAYAREQVEGQLRRLASQRGWDRAKLDAELGRAQEAYSDAHSGLKPSLGNAFAALGVSIAQSVTWREELIRPEDYLSPDQASIDAIAGLAASYRLAALTNNPVSIGQRSLRALGLEGFFPIVVGLDSCLKSKPEPEPFLAVLDRLGLAPRQCLSVGDRHDVDLAPAIKLGMSAILVESLEDLGLIAPEVRKADVRP